MSSHMTGIVLFCKNIRITELFTIKCLLFCEFIFDAVCVKLCFLDSNMVFIGTIAVENEVMYVQYVLIVATRLPAL